MPAGYEKAIVTLANLFVSKGHSVTLIILDTTKEIFFPIDPAITVIQQPLSFGITAEGNMITRKVRLLGDVLKLRKLLKQNPSTHIIATEYPFVIAAVLAGAHKKAKLFSWEHHHFAAVEKNSFWNFLARKAYPQLDAIICLNASEKLHYVNLNKNSIVIPNFIEPILRNTSFPKKTDILSVTRFNFIKGIDLLMQVAKIVLKENPTVTWKVIGYGIEEEKLKQFIRDEDLTNQFSVQPALESDITEEYLQASVFVMSSRNECFPLVLLEAMAAGLPCIAFDCETGPRHIIEHNKTGLLIPVGNIREMSNSISELIRNNSKRKEMSEMAVIAATKYTPDKLYESWDKLFSE